MFEISDHNAESAFLKKRKAILAIALKVGDVQVVPVYAFGHSTLWRLLQDPFGVRSISHKD